MAKRRPKENLYVDIDASIKRRMARLADKRSRKLTAEVSLALVRYLEEEEPKEGLRSEEEDD